MSTLKAKITPQLTLHLLFMFIYLTIIVITSHQNDLLLLAQEDFEISWLHRQSLVIINFIFIVHALLSTFQFKYVHDKNAINFLHSLAFTRKQYYIKTIFNIIIYSTTFYVISILTLESIFLDYFTAPSSILLALFMHILLHISLNFILINIFIFSIIITGNIVMTFIFGFVVSNLFIAVILYINQLFTVYYFLDFSIIIPDFIIDIFNNFINNVFYYDFYWDSSQNYLNTQPIYLSTMIMLLITVFMSFALSYFTYLKLNFDNINKPITFKSATIFFNTSVAIICSTFIGAILYNTSSISFTIILTFIGFTVTYLFATIFTMGLYNINKNYFAKSSIIFIIALFFISVATFDLLGLHSKLPNNTKIDSVQFKNLAYSSNNYITITDEKTISSILSMHEEVVNKDDYYTKYKNQWDAYKFNTTEIGLNYIYDNGDEFFRIIFIDDMQYSNIFENIYSKSNLKPLILDKLNYLKQFEYNDNFYNIEYNEAVEISMDMYNFFSPLFFSNSSYVYSNDMLFSPKEYNDFFYKLINAYETDVLADDNYSLYSYHSPIIGYININPYNKDMFLHESYDFPVFANYANTLDLLDEYYEIYDLEITLYDMSLTEFLDYYPNIELSKINGTNYSTLDFGINYDQAFINNKNYTKPVTKSLGTIYDTLSNSKIYNIPRYSNQNVPYWFNTSDLNDVRVIVTKDVYDYYDIILYQTK